MSVSVHASIYNDSHPCQRQIHKESTAYIAFSPNKDLKVLKVCECCLNKRGKNCADTPNFTGGQTVSKSVFNIFCHRKYAVRHITVFIMLHKAIT